MAAVAREGANAWKSIVARFATPSWWRAAWQLTSTLAAYVAAWTAMYFALSLSWWLLVPLVPLAGGLLTFTPYRHWRGEHAVHHGATGDLDRRGTGDVWTMTVREYLDASRWKRVGYRIMRNPLVLFVVAPFVLFTIWHRFPRHDASTREKWSVWLTNVALAGLITGMSYVFGLGAFLTLQLLVLTVAGSIGIWLFYLQHQFEHAYWQRGEQWDYVAAALQGSSFLMLPRVLQWFSGNIGFHHIHHLSPRIPNYHLERCHVSSPLFQQVPPMTLRSSVQSLRLRLWDEAEQRLVGYRHLRNYRART